MFNKPKPFIILAVFLLAYFCTFAQGKIIMNGATMNVVNSAYVVTKDVSLTNASTVNINNSTIKIAGSISNSGTFDVTNGTVEMNGLLSQTIPLNAFFTNKIKNLIISNNVTLAGQDSLTGILSFGAFDSKTFSTAGFLTLKSSATGTASVADLTNEDVNTGNQVLGDVIVERYISAAKKWRFLSIPTSTTQTIKASWQEGSTAPNDNLVPGFGTQITGAGGTIAGFDIYTASPSMKTYNAIVNGWAAIPNTNAALINNLTNNTIAYFVFVRGNRAATLATSPVTATVLRTKGVIKQGDLAVVTIASPATVFTAVGNPYPSRIDLRSMTPAPTTSTKIYVWDPFATSGSINGLGAYQTLTYDGTTFTVTPGGGSYGAPYNQDPNFIESGEAFLVGGNSSPYNITFKEDIKSSGNNLVSFTDGLKQFLQANLFINKNGVTSLMDGIRADIGNNFSNYIDNDDAFKLLNSSENVSLKRNGQLLSVERHDAITTQDTFYLNTGNMTVQNYQWQLKMDNMDQPGLTGFLVDNYKHTSTPVNLNGSTIVNFNIENISGSNASDRFSIVFMPTTVLPLSFTIVTANLKNKVIDVEWKVENESNIRQYEVERSADGNSYSKVDTTAAKNTPVSNYNWLDVNPIEGYNYYRIKSVDINGKTDYSKVVKVFTGTIKHAITVFPNPVKDGIINLQLLNQPSGIFEARLFNNAGQVISSKQILHAEGSSTETFEITNGALHGIYHLEITQPDNNKISIKVLFY